MIKQHDYMMYPSPYQSYRDQISPAHPMTSTARVESAGFHDVAPTRVPYRHCRWP